ncbi:hypothetical protein Hamer_G004860 [Homarus americanus]|uniref:Protein Star n=1 Tax=Homarus americanus TaxID=6706 RepID=A0A8J5JYX8_HOMAM|nr:hypothetical protein Hamer_G004860 [Homarus americanus]
MNSRMVDAVGDGGVAGGLAVQRNAEQSDHLDFTLLPARRCLRQRLRERLHWQDKRLMTHLQGMMEAGPGVASRLHPQNPPWARRPSYNATENYLRALTDGEVDGVFVEIGAQDGQWLSNTWRLEATQGWRGLLVEADPRNYQRLRTSPRTSSTLPVCVTPGLTVHKESMIKTHYPNTATEGLLRAQEGRSKLRRYATASEVWAGDEWSTTCYPIISVLAAFRYRKIDLLTLDLSGGGLEMTLDFLSKNKQLGSPFFVRRILYQDSQLSQFFDLNQVREDFKRLGYHMLMMKPVHYLLYHESISVAIH